MREGGRQNWREAVAKHQAALLDDLAAQVDSEVRSAAAEAKRLLAEQLAGAARRMRTSRGEAAVFESLNECCAAWAGKSVVLLFESSHAVVAAARGVFSGAGSLRFEIAKAAALATTIDTRDVVVAVASPAELSAELARAFEDEEGGDAESAAGAKAYLFPVLARQSVVAVLVAGDVKQTSPLELLCEIAGLRIEALAQAPVADAVPAQALKTTTWDALTADEQRLHLRAQRAARVAVAKMRLEREPALREGMRTGDVYRALRAEIDAARSEFRSLYVAPTKTMVDYLHLELLRNFAGNDDKMMGPDYPGPMV